MTMEEVANQRSVGLEGFIGFFFDASLVAMAFFAFQPLVESAGKAPNVMVAISLVANCLAAGLTLAAVQYGVKLPDLWGFEGLLMVLTPASAFAMPLVYSFLAPEGVLGNWVWYMPLVTLFLTIAIYGALADNPIISGRYFLLIRAVFAFVWLITAEALIVAFTRFGVEEIAMSTAVLLMTLCWMPARLISAGINRSRLEMISAIAAYGFFISSLYKFI